jgi:hypothetical protein
MLSAVVVPMVWLVSSEKNRTLHEHEVTTQSMSSQDVVDGIGLKGQNGVSGCCEPPRSRVFAQRRGRSPKESEGNYFSSTAIHTTPCNGTAQTGHLTDIAPLYVNIASLLAFSRERLMLHLWTTRTRLSHENTSTQATAASHEEEILLQCLRERRN